MARDDEDDTTLYTVVVNEEGHYATWPAARELPLGWTAVGKPGLEAECLAYLEEIWADMRPLSWHKKIEELEAQRRAGQGD